jgi:hypothetical protein
MEISQDILIDLELINGKKLDALIKKFIVANKLGPKNIIILLSTQLTYDKDFPHGSIEVEKHIEEFLELVPFESVISKKALLSGRTKVIAANKEFCDGIKESFVNAGFIVSGIYPLSLCLELAPELQSSMDLNLVINKVPELRNFNLMPSPEVAINSMRNKEKPNRNRLFLLIGVMVFLGLILASVIYTNIISPKTPARRTNVLPKPTIVPQQNVTTPVNVSSASGEFSATSSGESSVIISPTVIPITAN